MQAILLAAGMGKRLGDLTKNNTKCMVPVNGVPLVERLMRQLESLEGDKRLNRIVIVTGYEGKKLQAFIDSLHLSIPVEFVDNPIYATTNNIYSLYLAKDYLVADDTLLFESDLIFDTALIHRLLDAPYPSLALVAKFESWMDGTVVTLDEEDNIKRFIPGAKFKYEEAEEYFKTVNIYKFGKDFSRTHYVPFLAAYSQALGNNEYYEQVLRVIALLDRPEIKALRLDDEAWYEIDDVQDLDIAESIFCRDEEKLPRIASRHGGYWRYPKMTDFSSFIHPYFPDDKLRSELTHNLDRLLQGYPSNRRINNLLAAKIYELKQEYVCIGNGASELIKAYLDAAPGKVGLVLPTFEEYVNRISAADLVPFETAEQDFRYTADELITHFTGSGISTLLLVNPGNPTGTLLPDADVRKLCAWTREQGIRLLADESFIDFADAASLLCNETLAANPQLTVIKSISKACGVSGLRIGMLATADSTLRNAVDAALPLWNLNSLAEFFLQIFGKYGKRYTAACRELIAERERFIAALAAVPYLRVLPSQGNYLLAEVSPPHTPAELAQTLLLRHNILLRDCAGKRGMGTRPLIRIAVRRREDNDKLLSALTEQA